MSKSKGKKNNEDFFKNTDRKCKTLQSFCMYIKKISQKYNSGALCFRGHALKSWEIEPSIFRSDNEKILEKKEEIYNDIFRRFPDDFPRTNEKKYELKDLVKLQHYDIPTELLDVSFNPFVALFFATEEKSNKNGIVYVFNVPNCKIITNSKEIENLKENTKEPNCIFLYEPELKNPRIKAQNGAFLYQVELKEELSKVNLAKSIKKDKFTTVDNLIVFRIEINAGAKKELRNELKMIGISNYSLFPELDKISKDVKERYLNN